MNKNKITFTLKNIFIVLSLFAFTQCYDKLTNNPISNLSPNSSVFLKPDSVISSQPSKIHIYWSGDDADGLIIGFYFSWDGVNWAFTTKNDSLFALQIGVVDTNYLFRVSSVDNGGNGVYDNQIIQNNINYGPEPFIDKNNNNKYDVGETFIDIGLIDPTPATVKLPIKNSAPTIFWNQLSFVPDTSFSAMTFGWEATDIDGDGTIQYINIALNDTSNFVHIDGNVRRIAIRTKDFTSANPLMEILIDGNPNNIANVKLPGLKFNSLNKFFVQAVDISGAKSSFISLPSEANKFWYVKKPLGKLVIVDDCITVDNAPEFYDAMLDSLGFQNKYDVYDIRSTYSKPPYLNTTFTETIKLFNSCLWYTDNNPSLDLANIAVQKFLDNGGKILFSMQFPQTVDLTILQGFLPIRTDSSDTKSSILANTVITSANNPSYPDLATTVSLFRIRTFYLSSLGVTGIYKFANNELKEYIGFINSQKTLFFLGLPLHRMNGGSANVKSFLSKVLLQDFGLTP